MINTRGATLAESTLGQLKIRSASPLLLCALPLPIIGSRRYELNDD
jgi:hypothetical protein